MSFGKIGKFHVVKTLGSGAHSTILHVRRVADGKDYALKLVDIADKDDAKFLDQAKHEFRVSQMLQHPNLIRVHALETESDWLFRVKKAKLLIELVPGKTLDQTPIAKTARLLRVFEKIAAGLAHMHRRGVYHADMKPNNVMLGRGMSVKILDYGLAWIKGEPKDRVQGTPEYIAPETVSHKLVNERTDLYNFGAAMDRLTGWQTPPPVIGPGGKPLTEKSWTKLLKPVGELNAAAPPALCDLIHRCMCYQAVKRPERMAEVHEELERAADEAAAGCDPAELEE